MEDGPMPKGYARMEKKKEMMEKKYKEDQMRKIIRQEIRAAMKGTSTKKTTPKKKK